MADDVSECSTLATAIQEHILTEIDEVTLACVHNGVTFSATRTDGSVMRCVLAGVVCPAPRQAGYEYSKEHLLEILEDHPFTVLTHSKCKPWYTLTHAEPVTVIIGTEDLRLVLLKNGWVKIDSKMPEKCRKMLFHKPYWTIMEDLEKEALKTFSGLNANIRTRAFIHPKTFYKVVDADSPDIFFATKPPKAIKYTHFEQ